MKKVIFVTTNTGKFEEVKRWLQELDSSIELESAPLDIPEIQSLDIDYVATDKADKAFKALKKPLLVDDGGIYLNAYNNFPGALSKYVYEGIGLEGFWLLAERDPRAFFMFNLVYVDYKGQQVFQGQTMGRVIAPGSDEQEVHSQLPFTKVFIP